MDIKNNLWPQDRDLFDRMDNCYQSDNERFFFETLKKKMQYENAPWKEVLVDENDNYDKLTLMRLTYDEFILCHTVAIDEQEPEVIHVMNLSDILKVNLKESFNLSKDETLFEWLRERDYDCVKYDHSNDDD